MIILILALSVLIGFLFDRLGDRMERNSYPREYREYVEYYSQQYGVPEYVIYAVIRTESNFQSNAVSSADAIGLMQLTQVTFDWLMMKTGEYYEPGMLYDPETNIKYGTYLLSFLFSEYGNWKTVYAAYNAGVGRVNEWISGNEYADEYGNLLTIPIAETRNYVKKVSDTVEVYKKLYY